MKMAPTGSYPGGDFTGYGTSHTAGEGYRGGLDLGGLTPESNLPPQQVETCAGKSDLLTLLSRRVALLYGENASRITQYSNGLKKKKKKKADGGGE